ncbi:MAG: hypothetical protein Q4G43_15390 [Mobilicoccus sp.]|nr:hypothetical protein [Mobilicoccus sp.]
MTTQTDGLPSPDMRFGPDHYEQRWPLGAHSCELCNGVAIWQGPWDDRDVAVAERTFPGRYVTLDAEGNLFVGPCDPGVTRNLIARRREQRPTGRPLASRDLRALAAALQPKEPAAQRPPASKSA